jgi:hypothetical protein
LGGDNPGGDGEHKQLLCAFAHREGLGKVGRLLRITYLKTTSSYFVGRATPDAAGKARPTVNHLTVMIYVKLNNLVLQFFSCFNAKIAGAAVIL